VANEALLRIKVITDATAAATGLDAVGKKATGFRGAMQKAALPAAAVGAALVVLGKKALDSASTLEQAQGAVDSVYGKSAGAVEKYAESSAQSMGLAKSAYMNYAALVGAALQNSGFSAAKAADESNKIMQRAADMAATFGGTTADAVEAINAAVARGEYDPLEKYGVSLNATAVNAELAKRGQDDLTGAQLKNAKANIALEQIYKNTSKAAGQFARESDTAAGSSAIASAQFEDASAALGEALLPAAAAAANALAAVARWAQKNVPLVTALAAAIGTLVAAILIYNAAMKIAAIVQTAFNVAMSANVIFLVIVAIIALVAVFVILYKKVGWFRKAVDIVWAAMKAQTRMVAAVLKAVFKAAFAAISAYVKAWKTVIVTTFNVVRTVAKAVTTAINVSWRAVKTVAGAVWDWIRSKVSAVMTGVRTTVDNAIQKAKAVIQTVKDAFNNIVPDGLGAAMSAPFTAAKKAIDAVVSAIQSLINWVGSLISKIAGIHFPSVPKGLSGLLGKVTGRAVAPAGPTPRTYYTPAPAVAGVGARVAGPGAVTGGGAGVVVNVYGAIDPENTARQINRILSGHTRRVGRSA